MTLKSSGIGNPTGCRKVTSMSFGDNSRWLSKNAGSRKVLALVTDAHGGFGGIAQYNRDVLDAMCRAETISEIFVLPRLGNPRAEQIPDKITYLLEGLGSLRNYVKGALRFALRARSVDLIYCAHINLIPVAVAISKILGAPVVLAIYGVDAWKPVRRVPKWLLTKGVKAVFSISELTRDRFLSWCPVEREKTFIVPNAIRRERYSHRPRNSALMKRLNLEGKTTLMTLGRMSSLEQYKGFDEVIDVLPELADKIPNLAYLAVGSGPDRTRLEQKVATKGLNARVIFAGEIDESIKADFYQLADAYVMPSTGEGFGFVILEALASGVPVVGSSQDGTREALRDGELGILVDPADQESIKNGIVAALARPRGVPPGLEYFSFDRFCERLHSALASAWNR